jgi:hypothetical protein
VPIAHRYDEKAPKMSSSSAVSMDDVSDADNEQMETLSMVQLESHAAAQDRSPASLQSPRAPRRISPDSRDGGHIV